ncbi:MAG: GntR family transcriptional regulator [Spirochaetales bacterium]|nr:GntR family transcriptional regulator [Spirochaetales bacterium]MBQ4282273.1 GntR family transcriptional regulator [Spirochaetales bacterium]MBQ6124160.1 GntR family transcriptional regulator [Spirochaetales bacterium]MBQ9811317.1 GntR family transcriptional regulator [Spirochaetales bacterium]MBR6235086.1 GntR family transcriptional regulator [Spirochaetales bacterium]
MLTDVVYNDLRDKILSLTLKPGTELSFTNLKPLYNVSISPIRDALKHLENEGLVEIRPQSGTSVALIDMAKVRDERFQRLYLELGAVEKAFGRGISKQLITQWEDNIEKQKKAFACRDTITFLELDNSMHRLLFEACGHEKVFDSMLATSGNYHRIRMVSYLFDDIFSSTIDQHTTILNALKANSIEMVTQLERNHISKIEIETSGYQKAYPQYFK